MPRFGFHFRSPRVPASASTPAAPGCPLQLRPLRPPGARAGFYPGGPWVPASKLRPHPISFWAFAGQLPATQWLQGKGSGSVKFGVERSPRASFQLSFQVLLGARFSLDLGVPWMLAPAYASVVPGSPLLLPPWWPPGASFGFHPGGSRVPTLGACLCFHPGGPQVPASKLSPHPIRFLAFAGQLPATEWLQGDGSCSVKIGIERSPRASFQLSFWVPLGARFSLDLGVPRASASAWTLVSPGCPLRLAPRRPPGACSGFHPGGPRVPAPASTVAAPGFPLWLPLWQPRGACSSFQPGGPRVPASKLSPHPISVWLLQANCQPHNGCLWVPALASTPVAPGCLLRLPPRRPPVARFKVKPSSHQCLAFAGHLPAPQWLQGDDSGSDKISVERSPRAFFQLSFWVPLGARFSLDLGVPRAPASPWTSASPGCPLWLPLWQPPGACSGFQHGCLWVPASKLSPYLISVCALQASCKPHSGCRVTVVAALNMALRGALGPPFSSDFGFPWAPASALTLASPGCLLHPGLRCPPGARFSFYSGGHRVPAPASPLAAPGCPLRLLPWQPLGARFGFHPGGIR